MHDLPIGWRHGLERPVHPGVAHLVGDLGHERSQGLPALLAVPRDVEVESAPLDELDADLMQLTVPAGSRLHGVYLPELRLPEDAAVVLVVRDGRSFVPDDTTRLRRGDQALLVSARRSRAEAERRLRAVSRAGRLASWRGETGAASGAD